MNMTDGCPCAIDADSDISGVGGDPDITVESSEKTHKLYWKSKQHFIEHDKFSPMTIAYAYIHGNTIVLNEAMAFLIDNDVVAHEVGHNLGYRHTDGSLMDWSTTGTTDDANDIGLHETSQEVFEAVEDVTVYEWDRRTITSFIRRYMSKRDVPRNTVTKAVRQYMSNNGPDALYESNWRLDEYEGIDAGSLKKGQFY